jgi:hypothetical protein
MAVGGLQTRLLCPCVPAGLPGDPGPLPVGSFGRAAGSEGPRDPDTRLGAALQRHATAQPRNRGAGPSSPWDRQNWPLTRVVGSDGP